ncbi:MAG TPA: hypothetical protein VGV38_06745 [Pyrinomonadaceae bacterium]|nr:hypothetical protein [Pyrinomonadaceae bacterium]
MSQLLALVWLKWRLFRNSMRSRKAAAGGVASALVTLAALALSLAVASGLGAASYALASAGSQLAAAGGELGLSAYLFLLAVFAFVYLMWAVLPLGFSGGSHFDPGQLLLYPVSLRRLFALDWLSELSSIASIFALPSVLAVALGAGLANGAVGRSLLCAACALLFGVAFAKLVSTSVGALTRRRRTRGETLLAMLGALAGLSGAVIGQLAPYAVRYAEQLRYLRWTPPGAAALALSAGLREGGTTDFVLGLLTLAAYTTLFVLVTYRIAARAALGAGGARKAGAAKAKSAGAKEAYAGWKLPLVSDEMSAVVEKETRYVLRNAQLRMLALLPLILLIVRSFQRADFGRRGSPTPDPLAALPDLATYGEGLLAAAGVLYVFMILTALSSNLFAFEGGGMRSYVLAPVERRVILVGKNLTNTSVAFVFTAALLLANQLFFGDLSARALAFAALTFVLYAAAYALVGNWMSLHFPKRMEFGKRMNATGVAGLLIVPIIVVMSLPPLASVALGYLARSLAVKYATLAAFAAAAVGLYALLINSQGRSLARRERDILEAVTKEQ